MPGRRGRGNAARLPPQQIEPGLGKLQIEISSTATGEGVYVQIRSPAATGKGASLRLGGPVNLVLIADQVEILDRRKGS